MRFTKRSNPLLHKETNLDEIVSILHILKSFVLTNSIVQAIKNYFRFLRTLRAPFHFITREGETIDVLMQNYTFTDTPESEWATHIDIEVKEYIALGVGKDAYRI